MNKSNIIQILHDLSIYSEEIPPQLQESMSRLENVLDLYTENQFSMATDGVVSKPATEQEYNANDPGLLVSHVYMELNNYLRNHREEDVQTELNSLLHRLRGEVDAYERDYP